MHFDVYNGIESELEDVMNDLDREEILDYAVEHYLEGGYDED